MSGEGLCGTILIAPEGINATIAGPDAGVRALLAHLRSDPRFAGLVSKESVTETQPFQRWKVKVKPEILTFGAAEADPNVRAGTYVKPQDWNALIAREDVLLVDTRNDYEVAIGTFRGAVDPQDAGVHRLQGLRGRRTSILRCTARSPCSVPAASAARRRQRTCGRMGLRMFIISKAAS